MGNNFWAIYCGNSAYLNEKLDAFFTATINPNSCINHIQLISINSMLLLACLFITIKAPKTQKSASTFRIFSAVINTVLSLAYLALGLWTLYDQLRSKKTVLPLHGWLVLLFQGFSWLFLGLILSFKRSYHQASNFSFVKLCAIISSLYAAFISFISLYEIAVLTRVKSAKVVIDVILFPLSVLLLFCSFGKHTDDQELELDSNVCFDESYIPLQGSVDENQTLFSTAGFFSRMSFWWLNPLMKKGKEKVLEDEDIPKLRSADQAETCYRDFMEKFSKRKENGLTSIVPVIFSWQWKGIMTSGGFALVKLLALSTGPLFLKAFIDIAEGKKAFKYEGYILTVMLFCTKSVESLSERQWYFRTRLIGLQIRSMLSAAVYAKQFRLSNDAKMSHTPGEIVNYVTVDAYRIGEFPFWFHQIWTVILQMSIALVIIYYCVGNATIAALVIVLLSILGNSPLGKLQHKYQTKLMLDQDKRLRAITEALMTMKVLKVYAWENHFKKAIENLREIEFKWLAAVLLQKGYYMILFWSFPILMSIATFGACCFLGIPLNSGNVFTFLATLRIVQEPVRLFPDVAGAYIQASVSLDRIFRFLNATELQNQHIQQIEKGRALEKSIDIKSNVISWDTSMKTALRNVNLLVKPGEKVAICGEVGAGKSTLLAAILGEVPHVNGTVQVYGKLAYVSQTAWIQTGTIRDNILFGLSMDYQRYQDTLERCSLVKDIDLLPFGDLTVIGERGVNLSGGQKQRVQLARALYQDADLYLLDDPFSAVDAHTATYLFKQYIMEALTGKTVLLVTHQVDFLPTFDCILLMAEGKIVVSGTYDKMMTSSLEFQKLVTSHSHKIQSSNGRDNTSPQSITYKSEINEEKAHTFLGDQLIQKEEREEGDNGLKPYIQYLSHGKGFLYSSLAVLAHIFFLFGQSIQSFWLATNVQNSGISDLKLVTVYSIIGCSVTLFLFLRSFSIVFLGLEASRSIFSTLIRSLFRAPMSFFDATPVGRILSRVSLDISIIDLDVAMMISMTLASVLTAFFSFGMLAIVTWQVLLVIVPTIYLTILLQQYYFSSAKELMRINGTTKSTVASNLAETISGATTIRAFGKEDQYFSKAVELIDKNASPFFHGFSSNEWLIQRLEMLCAVILSCSALALTLLPFSESNSGFVGMALSYGLSLNIYFASSVQNQCMLANMIVSAERLEQYMCIPEEAPEIIPENRPSPNWPDEGKIEISDLKVKYRPNGPLVLQGISCIFEGGNKIGIVGRTGSGKTTLISTLFRLVEPAEGKIIIDGIDICSIGLHDLRSHLGIIPQDPTLFSGSVRHNLDPLTQHTDQEIWQVLEKCQLRDAVKDKEGALDSSVVQDGSNWSMGQRQLFCLGRALLKRRKIYLGSPSAAVSPILASSLGLNKIKTRSGPLPQESFFGFRPEKGGVVLGGSNLSKGGVGGGSGSDGGVGSGKKEVGWLDNVADSGSNSDSMSPESGGTASSPNLLNGGQLPRSRLSAGEANLNSSWEQPVGTISPEICTPEGQMTYDCETPKESESPRFQAILRVTSGPRKKIPADIKSFSHELNSKGVRPFPFWKPRGLNNLEEVLVMIRGRFEKAKEEVDSDLAVFAADLVGILEKNAENPGWQETIEDLLILARSCAMTSPNEFWLQCESIVQELDDRRQELPPGTLKQLHTRMLFILTRCTRLLQFHKESGFAEDGHALHLRQSTNLQSAEKRIPTGKERDKKKSVSGKLPRGSSAQKSFSQEQHGLGHTIHTSDVFPSAVDTTKSIDSPSGRERIASWKKFPSPGVRRTEPSHDIDQSDNKLELQKLSNKRVVSEPDPSKIKLSEVPSSKDSVGQTCAPSKHQQKNSWGYWGDQPSVSDESSIICRICEEEVATLHVEDHSRICTIADRCDQKGLSVNERLLRIADTLEKMMEYPPQKDFQPAVGSPDAAKVSNSSVTEESDVFSPKLSDWSRRGSEDMLDSFPEADNAVFMDDLKGLSSMSCKTRFGPKSDQGMTTSSAGSMTPRSPILTPRTSQIDLLLSGKGGYSEQEDHPQIAELADIARCSANALSEDDRSMNYLLTCLEDLSFVIGRRKFDALTVETFGARIEKLIREKYLQLVELVDNEKIDLVSTVIDEDAPLEDDVVRSLRTSPIHSAKDRTSIDDFEIMKPISRGAFGRVFLAKKRTTGDLFAIKVLKKADMIRKNAVESILAERNILISVRNPFVVRFFYSFTCRENLYLVMEYLNGGDLYSLLRNLGCLDEDVARVYIAEVVLALEYLHSLHVVHRDLKPDNLLIAHDGHIKLTDFGLSKVGLINSTDDLSGPAVSGTAIFEDDQTPLSASEMQQERRKKRSAVGTPDYLAPEILLGTGHGATADWWSVGVILFELIVGIPPFNAEHPQIIFDNILNRNIPWPQVPEEMTSETQDLIDKLLTEDPELRLGAQGASEVKAHPFFRDINWDTLARQKAAFVPASESACDTSYFTSRYSWNHSDDHVNATSEFEDTSDDGSASGSSGCLSDKQDEVGDECSGLTAFESGSAINYSFSNFSFKNLSQLASINYDLLSKGWKDDPPPNSNV